MPDDQPPPINREWLKRMRENKPALLHELCAMFLKDEPERIKPIRSAVETGDLELARYHAHSLKGPQRSWAWPPCATRAVMWSMPRAMRKRTCCQCAWSDWIARPRLCATRCASNFRKRNF
jgi:hypothetical protein